MKFQADVINGIYQVQEFDKGYLEHFGITPFAFLLESLKDCDENEIIFFEADYRQLKQILNEGYSVNETA